MINSAYKWAFAMIGLAPITVGLFCAGAKTWSNVLCGITVGVFICVIACFGFKWWLKKIKAANSGFPEVRVETVKIIGSNASNYFLAYVMPISLGGELSSPILLLAIFVLAFICFYSDGEANNPIARFLGYKFYEITTPDKDSYIFMSKKSVLHIKSKPVKHIEKTIKVIEVSDNFLIDADLDKH